MKSEDLFRERLKENKLKNNELIVKKSWPGIFHSVYSDRETNYLLEKVISDFMMLVILILIISYILEEGAMM